MPTEVPHDPVEGLDLDVLHRFLTGHVADLGPRLSAELVAGGRSNLTYRVTDGHHAWIVRRPPLGPLTPSAHDMAREFRVVAALADTPVPVPPAVALGDESLIGVPFAVTGFVDGPVLRRSEDLAPLSDAQVHACAFALIDVLAALHAVDPAAVGLGDFGRPQGYLRRQVDRWWGQWQRVATRDLPSITALHGQLDAGCPAESGAAIVHGDFRIDNAILSPTDPTDVRALVDWEMTTLGDPLADLGVHLAYADPCFAPVLAGSAAATSDRMPGRDAVIARYAATSGRDVDGLAFYIGLAYFKIAVIAEGIHARHLRGDTRGEGFDAVGAAVSPLVDAGLAAVRG